MSLSEHCITQRDGSYKKQLLTQANGSTELSTKRGQSGYKHGYA